MQLVWTILAAALNVFLLAAPYVLLGLTAAGFLHVLMPRQAIQRWMGGEGLLSSLRAAVFGVPLPICSCGVVPLAIELKKKGASKPASLSFLVTTPESGADSILLTWGLMGPLMAIVRPLASLVTAIGASILAIAWPGEAATDENVAEPDHCCKSDKGSHEGHDHDHDDAESVGVLTFLKALWYGFTGRRPPVVEGEPEPPALGSIVRRAGRYAFTELLDDIAFWLVIGIGLTALITALFPDDLSVWGLGSGIVPMLLILAASVPMYICASASTPVAAALIAKGISPGAALVMLMAGPATNAAAIVILTRNFGRGFVRAFLLGIILGSLACGLALDALIAVTGWQVLDRFSMAMEHGYSWIEILSGVALGGLVLWRFRHGAAREGWATVRDSLTAVLPMSFRSGVPGGRARLFGLVLVLAALLYAASGLQIVPPGHAGYGQLFGKVTWKDLGPGMHWVPPAPFGSFTLRRVDYPRKSDAGFRTDLTLVERRRQLRLSADPSQWHSPVAAMNAQPDETGYIAGDEKLFELSFTVHWGLDDPYAFFYKVGKRADLVRLYAMASAREFVAGHTLDELLTSLRPQMEAFIREDAGRRLKELGAGVRIDAVHVVDIHPPQEAVYAFRDVSSAKEDRETRIHEARRLQAGEVPRARGEAVREIARARAEADSAAEVAAGEARGFMRQAEVFARHRRILKDLLWLETSERVLADKEKFILPSGSAGKGVVLWRDSPALPPGNEN